MNLDAQQEKFLATLANGDAVAYSEGRETAFHIGIPHFARGQPAAPVPTKEEIVAHMRSHLDETLAPSDALPRTSTTATVDSIPPCAGCLPGTCTTREVVLRKLAQGGWKEGFEQAVANGWRGL